MFPSFTNPLLLTMALTHRSALVEKGIKESNERLEFLGDAVLELVTTEYLFTRFPKEPEGVLTQYRASLVKTSTLCEVSQSLGIPGQIIMSRGEESGGGRENPSLLADTFEAVIGALYLDKGYPACVTFLGNVLFPLFDDILFKGSYKDYKTTLQELVQLKGKNTPNYTTINEEGPDHMKVFTVSVQIDHESVATGVGKNKQDASQLAAKSALEKMGKS